MMKMLLAGLEAESTPQGQRKLVPLELSWVEGSGVRVEKGFGVFCGQEQCHQVLISRPISSGVQDMHTRSHGVSVASPGG